MSWVSDLRIRQYGNWLNLMSMIRLHRDCGFSLALFLWGKGADMFWSSLCISSVYKKVQIPSCPQPVGTWAHSPVAHEDPVLSSTTEWVWIRSNYSGAHRGDHNLAPGLQHYRVMRYPGQRRRTELTWIPGFTETLRQFICIILGLGLSSVFEYLNTYDWTSSGSSV